MPKFMDVHHGMHGITPEALKAAHQADVDIQGDEDVDFQKAWGDPESGMVWCVSEAPNAEAVKRIHDRAGHPATEVYPVPVEV
ncbi:MAG: SCO4226 family nickel-binding protein [Chloroflexota bacterium]